MSKIKIQIKNRWTGSILFEYEKENNTIKDTLTEAVKTNASLCGADLRDAYLRGADLGGADLGGAYLGGADLGNANLRGAYLRGADLGNANLGGADLGGAYLGGAYLGDANLGNANLGGADLRGAENIPYIPFVCPSDGAFIGWKKVHGKLIKLQIPEDAKRCSATSQKCRCDKALVLAITDIDGENPIHELENTSQSHHVLYKVGEMVYPDSFDENRWNECSHGIHFFINKQNAINYQ